MNGPPRDIWIILSVFAFGGAVSLMLAVAMVRGMR